MTQLTSLSQLGGKTIERVAEYSDYDDVLAIVFTDGTWFRIQAKSPYDGDGILCFDGVPDNAEYERLKAKYEGTT